MNLILAGLVVFVSFLLGAGLMHAFWSGQMRPIMKAVDSLLVGRTPADLPESKQVWGHIGHFLNTVSHSLKELKAAYKSQKRIQGEISAAQIIQSELLPKQQIQFPGLEIFAKTQPASEIGGDAYDLYTLSGDRHVMYLGDSTGHGLPAGMVMMMVDTLLESFLDQATDPKEVLQKTNRYLKPHLKPTMFMTLILAEWHAENSKFSWVGAGHEHVIHLKAADQSVTATPAGGIALGMLPDNSAMLKEQSIELASHDWVVLFSDGITEAKNEKLETFGLERLKEAIHTHASPDARAEDVFEKVISSVNQFMGSHPQDDDMSLLILKKT